MAHQRDPRRAERRTARGSASGSGRRGADSRAAGGPRDRADDAAEVVVEQHDRRDLARACVPRSPIAMPMSAAWSAGTSFTPSPVTATMPRPLAARARARASATGDARATTSTPANTAASWRASSASSVAPRDATGRAPPRPISRAIASAVAGWSPVTMITWMPDAPAATRSQRERLARTGSAQLSRPAKRSSVSGSAPLQRRGIERRRGTRDHLLPRLRELLDSLDPGLPLGIREIAKREDELGGSLHRSEQAASAEVARTAVSRRRSSVNGKVAMTLCGRRPHAALGARLGDRRVQRVTALAARRGGGRRAAALPPTRLAAGMKSADAQLPLREGARSCRRRSP